MLEPHMFFISNSHIKEPVNKLKSPGDTNDLPSIGNNLVYLIILILPRNTRSAE